MAWLPLKPYTDRVSVLHLSPHLSPSSSCSASLPPCQSIGNALLLAPLHWARFSFGWYLQSPPIFPPFLPSLAPSPPASPQAAGPGPASLSLPPHPPGRWPVVASAQARGEGEGAAAGACQVQRVCRGVCVHDHYPFPPRQAAGPLPLPSLSCVA